MRSSIPGKNSSLHWLVDHKIEDYNFRPSSEYVALPPGVRRHEWKGAHGYREAFKSREEQLMRPANVEILMGHDIIISTTAPSHLMKNLFLASSFLYDTTGRGGESIE